MAKAITVTKNMVGIEWLALIQVILGFEWVKAGWEKFVKPDFMDGLQKTFGFFASPKNPHQSYADFLQNSVIPNAQTFGEMVRFGELVGGLVLLISAVLVWRSRQPRAVYIVLAVTALLLAFLNWNFYMASAFTGPAAAGENTVMGLIELVLAVFYGKQALAR